MPITTLSSRDAVSRALDAGDYGIYGFLSQLPIRTVSGLNLRSEQDGRQLAARDYFCAARAVFLSLSAANNVSRLVLNDFSAGLLHLVGLRHVHWIGIQPFHAKTVQVKKGKGLLMRNCIGAVVGLEQLLGTIFLRISKPFCLRCNKVTTKFDLGQLLSRVKSERKKGVLVLVLNIGDEVEEKESLGIIDYLEMFDRDRAWIDNHIVSKSSITEEDKFKASDRKFNNGVVLMTAALPISEEQDLFLRQEVIRNFAGGSDRLSLYYLPTRDNTGELVGAMTKNYECPLCQRAFYQVSSGKINSIFGFGSDNLLVDEIVQGGDHQEDGLNLQDCDFQAAGLLSSKVLDTTVIQLARWVEPLEDDDDSIVKSVAKSIKQRLDSLGRFGFNQHKLGQSVKSFSSGEWARLELALFSDCAISDSVVVIDRALDLFPVEEAAEYINALRRFNASGCTYLIFSCLPEIVNCCDMVWHEPKMIDGNSEWLKVDDSLALIEPENVDSERKRHIAQESPSYSSFKFSTGCFRDEFSILVNDQSLISGPSGSGKSSLLLNIFDEVSSQSGIISRPHFRGELYSPSKHSEYTEVIYLSGELESQNRYLNLASFLGLTATIACFFAATPRARLVGLSAPHFTLQSHEHRCQVCRGRGWIAGVVLGSFDQDQADDSGDLRVQCPDCEGNCFSPEVLNVKFHGRTIREVLSLQVKDARTFFGHDRALTRWFKVLSELDLGCVLLGTLLNDLSPSQLQRLRLAKVIFKLRYGRRNKSLLGQDSRLLFLLDNICYGLSAGQASVLLDLFERLCGDGHTVVCADNHPKLLKNMKHVIELRAVQHHL